MRRQRDAIVLLDAGLAASPALADEGVFELLNALSQLASDMGTPRVETKPANRNVREPRMALATDSPCDAAAKS